jgi:acyl-CoA synthetase (AMP-forming)/AMP-acid ligase II
MSAGKARSFGGRTVRWDEDRAAQAYARGDWVRTTLADALRHGARTTPGRLLVIDDQRRLDCSTLEAEATALAHALLGHAPPGSVVSYVLPNWHEVAVIYLAATLAGMVVNPILPSLRERELEFILRDANSRFVFIPAEFRRQDYRAMLTRVCAALPAPPEVVVLRGACGPYSAYERLLARPSGPRQLPTLDPDAARMILYTSGTTGRPKGVLHSHNSIHALLRQVGANWLVEPGDLMLVPSPVGHITGSFGAVECPLLLGATALLMERWDSREAVALIDEGGCTHCVGATPFLEQLLAAARQAGTRLPSLKLFACGGASVPPSLVRDAIAYFANAAVTRVYGSTEVPLVTVGVPDRRDPVHAAETDGCAQLAEVRLVPHPAAPAGEGEIRARGPQMLIGYSNVEDEADAFDDDGFFRTGDIGRWVDDRYLVVTGRAKDIIIRNGENISPKEIEDLLIRHSAIAEVAVIGLPDARTGERACAVIVPRSPPGPDLAELGRFLGELGVARFKVPEQVEHWDTLPKNAAGKVLKHEIRAALTRTAG